MSEKPSSNRVFAIKLRPLPGCTDPIRALRRGLKFLLRACQLKCIEAKEEKHE